MDPQTVVNWVFGLAGALVSFVLKSTWESLKEVARDLSALQKSIADTYVRRDDFKDHADRVEAVLTRIESKLDSKQDK